MDKWFALFALFAPDGNKGMIQLVLSAARGGGA